MMGNKEIGNEKKFQSVSPFGVTLNTASPSRLIRVPAGDTPPGATPLSNKSHSKDKSLVVLGQAQQIRYSIQTRALDPSNAANLTPCLIREQGPFASPFVPDATQTTIIAENVIGSLPQLSRICAHGRFKVLRDALARAHNQDDGAGAALSPSDVSEKIAAIWPQGTNEERQR